MDQFLTDYLTYAKNQRISSSMPNISTIKDSRKAESIFDRIQQLNRVAKVVQQHMVFPDNELTILPTPTDSSHISDTDYLSELLDEDYENAEEEDFYEE
jgi:hypothetical protein